MSEKQRKGALRKKKAAEKRDKKKFKKTKVIKSDKVHKVSLIFDCCQHHFVQKNFLLSFFFPFFPAE